MSDFAARLVARAQGRGSILAPRAPPRFAPQVDEPVLSDDAVPWIDAAPIAASSDTGEVARPSETGSPGRQPEPEVWRPPAPGSVAAEDGIVSDPAVTPSVTPSVTPATPAVPWREPVPVLRAPAPVPGPETVIRRALDISPGHDGPAPRGVEAARVVEEPTPQLARVTAADAPVPGPARAANDRAPTPAAPPPAGPGVSPQAEPVAPSVVIEIGAVEFRTIQSAPPAAAPVARAAPSLSLDAYLAQRGAR